MAIGDFEAVVKSIDNALSIFANRGLKYLHMSITPKVDAIEVKFVNPGTTENTTDAEPKKSTEKEVKSTEKELNTTIESANETDISAATDEAVSTEIKDKASETYLKVAKGRAEIKAMGEETVALDEDESTWLTPPRGKTAPAVKFTQESETKPLDTNIYGGLQVDDDPGDDGGLKVDDDSDDDPTATSYDEFAGSRGMQQSFDSNYEDSPEKSEVKSEKDKLLERTDLRFRDKGWNHINRIVGKGETNKLSIEDLAYYINRGPRAMKQAKTETMLAFDDTMYKKNATAESHLQLQCNKVLDAAITSLNKEDGMVFNKIRLNRTQLDKEVTACKDQVARQIKVNENSHAITADLENRLTAHGKLQALCEKLTKTVESLKSDIKGQNQRIINLEGGVKPAHVTNLDFDDDDAPERDDFEPDLTDALPDRVPSTPDKTGYRDTSFTAKETTIPYGSRVLLKSGIMKIIPAYVMNVTQLEGKNLYHVRTSGQTNMFVSFDEILSVEKEGDPNIFEYGYDPGRSMTIFHQHINSLRNSTSTPT